MLLLELWWKSIRNQDLKAITHFLFFLSLEVIALKAKNNQMLKPKWQQQKLPSYKKQINNNLTKPHNNEIGLTERSYSKECLFLELTEWNETTSWFNIMESLICNENILMQTYSVLPSLIFPKHDVLINVLMRGEHHRSVAMTLITSWLNYWEKNLHRCKLWGEKVFIS